MAAVSGPNQDVEKPAYERMLEKVLALPKNPT